MSWKNIKEYQLDNSPLLNIITTEETLKSSLKDNLGDIDFLSNSSIDAVLIREYAKGLATTITNQSYIYCDNIDDALDFALFFIMKLSKVYKLKEYPYSPNIGTSIQTLITEYDSYFTEKHNKWTNIRKFLIKLPTKQDGGIAINDEYLDQYAPYYKDALKLLLSVLATIFNNNETANEFKIEDFIAKFDDEYDFAEQSLELNFLNPLQNIEMKSEGVNNIHIFLKDIHFNDTTQWENFRAFIKNSLIKTITFENCLFKLGFMELYNKSFIFNNCTFNCKLFLSETDEKYCFPQLLRFENNIFNNPVNIQNIQKHLCNLIVRNCNFSRKADLYITDIKKLAVLLQNTTFEGVVAFENIMFEQGKYANVIFLNELRTKNLQFTRYNRFGQIVFGANVVRTMNHSIKSFVKSLKDNGFEEFATELEQFYLNELNTIAKEKSDYEIALQSNWLNIKQAAKHLGISYNTLLTMRKEDKANGGEKTIYYRGQGKNSRYYVPFLDAYKVGDSRRATEIARELEEKFKD